MRKMKDSGVEWIGEIPEDWKIIRFRFFIKEYKAGPFGSSLKMNGLESDGNILIYTPEHITNKSVDSVNNLYLPVERSEEMAQFFVKEGDIIFPIVGSLGRAMIISRDMPKGIINQRVAKFRLDNTIIDTDYFMWLFSKSSFFETYIDISCRGSFIVNLTKGIINDMSCVVPDISKQKQIANYLDSKCSKIDSIISKQEQIIEKLKEYKLSLITETVTKGLDPDVEMKAVYGEWIDCIPKSWNIMMLKWVTEFITCGVASTPEYTDEEDGVLFLSAQNVKHGVMDYSVQRYITTELHKSLTQKRKPTKGDILQVRVGASIGNVAVVDTDKEFSVYVSLTHMRCNKRIINRYLMYCLMNPLFLQKALSYVDFAGSQGNLNVADLKVLKVPVPLYIEQKAIVDYLDHRIGEIDKTIKRRECIVNRLSEYKKSLIYEVVTGKKEIVA